MSEFIKKLQNFKLIIEYDGRAYHGWQRQKKEKTIQGEIEKALEKLTGAKVALAGSGRTDAGVHAYGQVASFKCHTNLTCEIFQKGLNSLTPDDIVITSCEAAPEDFHARYDVKSKTYHYRILNRSLPAAIGRMYAWHIRKKLDIRAMKTSLEHIAGTHDFKSFEGSGSPRNHSIRTIISASILKKKDGYLVIEIEGDGFLRFMVRNIVGTLVDTGLGKISSDDFKKILYLKDRNSAGITAPAHGLFLVRVTY